MSSAVETSRWTAAVHCRLLSSAVNCASPSRRDRSPAIQGWLDEFMAGQIVRRESLDTQPRIDCSVVGADAGRPLPLGSVLPRPSFDFVQDRSVAATAIQIPPMRMGKLIRDKPSLINILFLKGSLYSLSLHCDYKGASHARDLSGY
jgi:hypothetical protein